MQVNGVILELFGLFWFFLSFLLWTELTKANNIRTKTTINDVAERKKEEKHIFEPDEQWKMREKMCCVNRQLEIGMMLNEKPVASSMLNSTIGYGENPKQLKPEKPTTANT